MIHRIRATVITRAFTYESHALEIDETNDRARITTPDGTVLAELSATSWSSSDGKQYRVEGVDEDGVRQVWRAVQKCARCLQMKVVPTPDYDIPV